MRTRSCVEDAQCKYGCRRDSYRLAGRHETGDQARHQEDDERSTRGRKINFWTGKEVRFDA